MSQSPPRRWLRGGRRLWVFQPFSPTATRRTWPIPFGPSNRQSGFGQAAQLSSIPGAAFFRNHDPVHYASMFALQHRPRPERHGSFGGGRFARRASCPKFWIPDHLAQSKPRRAIDVSEPRDLMPIGKNAHEKTSRQMGRRRSAQQAAPATTQEIEIEAFQRLDLVLLGHQFRHGGRRPTGRMILADHRSGRDFRGGGDPIGGGALPFPAEAFD